MTAGLRPAQLNEKRRKQMRGTKAKRLRKEVYGESSKRNTGEYAIKPDCPGRGTRICAPTSLRAKYQLAKKGA